MPKGFLVKRQKHSGTYSSWRCRKTTSQVEEERHSDSGSDQENVYTAFGSPDSGYSASPVSMTFKETVMDLSTKDLPPPPSYPPTLASERRVLGSLSTTTTTSPLSVGVPPFGPPGGSPFHCSSFDRLSVSSPSNSSRPSPGGSSVASRGSPGPVQVGPMASFSPPLTTMPPPAAPVNPTSPSKKRVADGPAEGKTKTPKKSKAARKITFDEDKSSPVSGTIIKDYSDDEDEGAHFVCGDIEPSMNFVDITPEAKAEIARIDNKIGDYICQLCREFYTDAFQLAQHKCSRIVHVEYRCPECDKVFNCPANLASHRRWHKPRPITKPSGPKTLLPTPGSPAKSESSADSHEERRTPTPPGEEPQFECSTCGKKFKRQAYLRKHMASHDDNRPYPCRICNKMFRSEATRSKHMVQHTADALVRTVVAKTIPPTSLVPPPPQSVPLALTNHVIPRTDDVMTCEICHLPFTDRTSLERHQRMHTTEIFNCKYCPSKFYSSPGLTRHINKCHPSESRQIIMLQMPLNRTC